MRAVGVPGGEDGAGNVLLLALCSVLVIGALAVGALVQVAVARHQAASAADLGALAAADLAAVGDPGACAVAARVVAANGGTVAGCLVHADGSVQVGAQRQLGRGLPLLGALGPAQAVARAGQPP